MNINDIPFPRGESKLQNIILSNGAQEYIIHKNPYSSIKPEGNLTLGSWEHFSSVN